MKQQRPSELFRVDCQGTNPDIPRMGFALRLHEAIQLAAEMHTTSINEHGEAVLTAAPRITAVDILTGSDIGQVRWTS